MKLSSALFDSNLPSLAHAYDTRHMQIANAGARFGSYIHSSRTFKSSMSFLTSPLSADSPALSFRVRTLTLSEAFLMRSQFKLREILSIVADCCSTFATSALSPR